MCCDLCDIYLDCDDAAVNSTDCCAQCMQFRDCSGENSMGDVVSDGAGYKDDYDEEDDFDEEDEDEDEDEGFDDYDYDEDEEDDDTKDEDYDRHDDFEDRMITF